MATLAPPDSPSPTRPRRRMRSFARKCERCCCAIGTYFPLAFVYSLTTWAVWVEASLGFLPSERAWTGVGSSTLGIVLYILLNTCYSVAVFTNPGSPVDSPASTSSKNGYSHLPTSEPRNRVDHLITSITVSSTGAPRFCKKCLAPKPDRAHHCSTCGKCVMKMDHHCPWLATCVGLHNYKAFLLFLIYSCIFCWLCLAVTAGWVWSEVLSDMNDGYLETMMPINVIMLAIVAGIIGLVLSGFTAWHISLAFRGITTIECLEKTRYLSPMRKAYQQQLLRQQHPSHEEEGHVGEPQPDFQGMFFDTIHKTSEQLFTAHANAIPGVTRDEEGEERVSPVPTHHQRHPSSSSSTEELGSTTPAQASLSRHHRTPQSREASEERRRYQEYLDEEFAPKLPHAFDLGWRKNLNHLFGPNPWFWGLPICNTSGDGWRWEINPGWFEARDRVAEEQRREAERVGLRNGSYGYDGEGRYEGDRDYDGQHPAYYPPGAPSVESPVLESDRSQTGSGMSLKTLDLKRKASASTKSSMRREWDTSVGGEVDSFEVSDDDEEEAGEHGEEEGDGDIERGRGGWKKW